MLRLITSLAVSLFTLTVTAAAPALAADNAPVVTRVRLFPRDGAAPAIVGAQVVGSNLGETVGFVELAKVAAAPAPGQWAELKLDSKAAYRFVKFVGPPGSHANLAELEFYAGDVKLAGKPFGIAGSRAKGCDFTRVFDGDIATFFDALLADGAYVGLDLGTPANTAPAPALAPAPGKYPAPQRVTLATTAPSAAGLTIRYTTDGSTPAADNGTTYAGPIAIDKGVTSIRAVALADGKFASPVAGGAYIVGDVPAPKGLRTYHVGNSLTDTIDGWLKPVADSAGYEHKFHRFTIPGAPTDWLWDHPGSGFGDSKYAEAFTHLAPIDHLSIQPFAGHGRSVENEADHANRFYRLAREASPNVQLWLYVQWPSREVTDRWAKAQGKDIAHLNLKPAATWEEAIANHTAYTEAVRDHLAKTYGTPALIVPGGAALVTLKKAVEAGQVPGQNDFFIDHFSKGPQGPGTDFHLTPKGRYLVALVFYACIYRESPEGKVKLPEKVTTLTPEQDKIYQRIAWETVKSYPPAALPR